MYIWLHGGTAGAWLFVWHGALARVREARDAARHQTHYFTFKAVSGARKTRRALEVQPAAAPRASGECSRAPESRVDERRRAATGGGSRRKGSAEL